jgi:hypothetical protein
MRIGPYLALEGNMSEHVDNLWAEATKEFDKWLDEYIDEFKKGLLKRIPKDKEDKLDDEEE